MRIQEIEVAIETLSATDSLTILKAQDEDKLEYFMQVLLSTGLVK